MAGRLRHYLTIQQQATTQDAVGQRVDTWTDAASLWGWIRPKSGRDYVNASGEHAEITHEILLRDEITIRPGDRIVYGTRTFDARVVLKIAERDRYLNVLAVENAE